MKKEALKRIFEFLEDNEGKKHKEKGSFLWKITFNEPLTKEELNVKGNLDLRNSNIESLPEGLKVGSNLYLQRSKITSLPKGLKVGGDLDLRYLKIITSLPEGLKVGGGLYLVGCKNLTSLPEGLEVGGDLDLYNTEIRLLPQGLKVGGYLYINTTPLTKYTDEELREMIKPGFIKGKIIR